MIRMIKDEFVYDEATGFPVVPEGRYWRVSSGGPYNPEDGILELIEDTLVTKDYVYEKKDWIDYWENSTRMRGQYAYSYVFLNERKGTRVVKEPGKGRWFRASVPVERVEETRIGDVYKRKVWGSNTISGPFDRDDLRTAAEELLTTVQKEEVQASLYGTYPPKKLEA